MTIYIVMDRVDVTNGVMATRDCGRMLLIEARTRANRAIVDRLMVKNMTVRSGNIVRAMVEIGAVV